MLPNICLYSRSDVAAVSRGAVGIGGDGDVDLLQRGGLVTPGLQGAPPRHRGQLGSGNDDNDYDYNDYYI